MATVQAFQIGVVPYLNAVPLVARARGAARLFRASPARLVGALAGGKIDAGLLPSLAYALRNDWALLRAGCIASRGPVGSVRLFCRKPLARVRRIALDPDSVTSSALLRILCARVFALRPRFGVPRSSADALLRIGDAGLRAPPPAFSRERVDLGEVWDRWTGLPFVYALWMARRAGPPAGLAEVIRRMSSASSRVSLEAVARREAPRRSVGVEEARRYLARQIRYRLGPAEEAGLVRFYREAARARLIRKVPRLVFHDDDE